MRPVKDILLVLALATAAMAGSANSVFRGTISDTQCAMNVHSLSRSHEEMIAKQTLGKDAASCAKNCVRRGGEWVLRSGDKVYRLKNQVGVDRFAGKNVSLSGTLDPATDIIDNSAIEEIHPSRKSD